jgi:hypothetical protein
VSGNESYALGREGGRTDPGLRPEQAHHVERTAARDYGPKKRHTLADSSPTESSHQDPNPEDAEGMHTGISLHVIIIEVGYVQA